jgi:hypothetical protein
MIKQALSAISLVFLVKGVAAGEPLVPTAAQIANCSADPVARTSEGQFSNLNVTCSDVTEFLGAADVVSEWQWLHGYSHVAFGDRTGRLTLHDGTELHWMIRPGGLGYLEFADGRNVYLVRCCLKRSSNDATETTPSRR